MPVGDDAGEDVAALNGFDGALLTDTVALEREDAHGVPDGAVADGRRHLVLVGVQDGSALVGDGVELLGVGSDADRFDLSHGDKVGECGGKVKIGDKPVLQDHVVDCSKIHSLADVAEDVENKYFCLCADLFFVQNRRPPPKSAFI